MGKPFEIHPHPSKKRRFMLVCNASAAELFGARKPKQGFYAGPIAVSDGRFRNVDASEASSLTAAECEAIAHLIGRYHYGFGDLVFTYCERVKP